VQAKFVLKYLQVYYQCFIIAVKYPGGVIMFFRKKKKTELPFRAYSGSEPFVFVSYAHADSSVVYPILKELHGYGVHMWYDEGIDVGTEWSQKIADNILICSKFLLFVSPASMKSHHVRQEINFANTKNKPIMPVHIKPTQLNAGLEMTLSVFQAIFYYAYKINKTGFYRELCDVLLGSLADADADATAFLDADATVFFGKTLLRLDEHGDNTLPPVIHLPEHGTFSIGRFDRSVGTKQSDFEFSREKTNISRRHALFEHTHRGYTVTDLGSKTGTWVNGQRISPNRPILLMSGYRVSFGSAGAVYVFEG